jgi:hypothetical protein
MHPPSPNCGVKSMKMVGFRLWVEVNTGGEGYPAWICAQEYKPRIPAPITGHDCISHLQYTNRGSAHIEGELE